MELVCNFEFLDKDIEIVYEKGIIEIIGNIIYSINNCYFNFCVFFVKKEMNFSFCIVIGICNVYIVL